MNKQQQTTLQAKDARYVTDIIDEGFDSNEANHVKTQSMLGELLQREAQVGMKPPPLSFGGVTLDREYYNLFVIGDEVFNGDSFTISKAKSLVEYIEPDVKERFFPIREDRVVEQIFTLPSLFMSENKDHMKSHPGRKVTLGRVTELKIEKNDIRIFFVAETRLFQQSITDVSKILGIHSAPGYSELNNTHWTIKRLDLMDALTGASLIDIR